MRVRQESPREEGRARRPGARLPHPPRVHRTGPNQRWLTDIPEHSTAVGKLNICAVKDVWSTESLVTPIDSRMTPQFAVDALESAVA